jgi:hypothetical protein
VVITNSVLVTRRIRELQRRREGLVVRQERLRGQLPEWAIEPLRLAGLTRDEIRRRVDEWASAESASGLHEIDQEIDALDRQVEELEELLVQTPSESVEEVSAVLDLAVARLRSMIVTDPGDVFYDHGEARALALLDHVRDDLEGLLRRERLNAG